MSQLASTLREAADKNNELLNELRQTDYAPSSLKQNTAYISDLQGQISKTDKELVRLHQITEDERKDHVSYRDSNFKRYMHKMGGSKGKDKFASKSEKEEKEFLDAWQKERSTKESRDEQSRALEQAQSDKTNLENDCQRHETAQSSLDALYNSIFSGPTPDVPGEDDLERAVQQSKQTFDFNNQALSSEKQALSLLSRADQSLQQAHVHMQDALRRSRRDTYLGGGGFTDMMERDALAQSQNAIHATQRHMDEARRVQPQLRPLTEISIDQGHLFSDVLFDNIFTDMAQHERIKNSDMQLAAAARDLHGQIGEQRGRCQGADANLKQAGADLEAARKELQRVRGEAFERLAGGDGGIGGQQMPPPQYAV
ncbi:hypothetical protein Slin15195_G030940 [Septoria linicola]|uniref:Uncharacterized protein n=1 Tax=Septoria linicola TaxID=215465 RepID=A0A9Q9AIQ1_9PEZI|nr:hypothetical protein Slin14017_G029960 [Septoria linicola]USW49775.1 hypothetical protein Slin15195_G030940 [Septoria linicola]